MVKSVQEERVEKAEKGNFAEVIAKAYPAKKEIVDLMKELKSDPEFRPYLVPIPDYGAVNCLISMKILRELRDARKERESKP